MIKLIKPDDITSNPFIVSMTFKSTDNGTAFMLYESLCNGNIITMSGINQIINVSVPYFSQIAATGGNGAYSFTLTSGELPVGLTLSSTGIISGTPISTGDYSFTIEVSDSNSCLGEESYSLSIECPVITTYLGQTSYSAYNNFIDPIVSSGGSGGYSYSISNGVLPVGVIMEIVEPYGWVIHGTPMSTGSYPFTISSIDSSGCVGSSEENLSIFVNQYTCPSITLNPTIIDSPIGTLYNAQITASGGTAPYIYSITSGSLPIGLVLNPDGSITGTPTVSGTYTFTYQAVDFMGCIVNKNYSIKIYTLYTLWQGVRSNDGTILSGPVSGGATVYPDPMYRVYTINPEIYTNVTIGEYFGEGTLYLSPGFSNITNASIVYSVVGEYPITINSNNLPSIKTLNIATGTTSSISTIQSSYCPALLEISIIGPDYKISTIDVSHSTVLKEISIVSDCIITTINASDSLSTNFGIEYNGNVAISTIDMSNCGQLGSLKIWGAGDISITTLDMSNCNNLLSLQPAGAGNFSITNINVRNCSSITSIDLAYLSDVGTAYVGGASTYVSASFVSAGWTVLP